MSHLLDAVRLLGREFLQPTLPALVWLVVHRLVPAIRTPSGLVALSAATTALFYRERMIAWMGIHLVCALQLAALHRLPAAGGVRWRRSLWSLGVWTAVFLVVRMSYFDRWQGWIFASSFPGQVLDMLVYLKLVTAFWEVGAGRIRTLSSSALWAWLMMPWPGVLLRLSEFLPQWPALLSRTAQPADRARIRSRVLDWAGHLAVWGVFVVAGGLLAPMLESSNRARLLWSGFVTGPASFYLVAHLTARTGQILASGTGLALPDNFRLPFGRPNLSDFWANWNISYTNVFRDLLFFQRWGMKKPNPYLNSVLLFVLVGFWHSAMPFWIVWGLFHGLGFAGYLYWRHSLKGILAARWNLTLPLGPVSSGLLTYGFVCLGWLVPPQINRGIVWLWESVLARVSG